MEIAYTNSRADQIALARASNPSSHSRLAYQHYSWVVYWGVMAALGVAVSIAAEFLFAAVMFVTMYLSYFFRAVPYSKVWNAATRQGGPAHEARRIRLRICDEGLHETVEDVIESFVPWEAVKGFHITPDHLLIELAGDLWANVPRHSVTQGATVFDEFVTLLRKHGVQEIAAGKSEPSAAM